MTAGTQRALCRLDELPDGGARGFPAPPGGYIGLFAVRQGDAVHVYVNCCPHVGTALDWAPDRFLAPDGSAPSGFVIVCSTHGARFNIHDGACIRGPCVGAALEAVPVQIEDGVVLVPSSAGL